MLVAHPPDGGICTTDLTTTPMAVAIDPKQIDVHHRLTIHLCYYDSKKPITTPTHRLAAIFMDERAAPFRPHR